MRQILTPKTEAHWLELRRDDVTSTMSPALFGMSPYLTAYELFHSKTSGVDTQFHENSRIKWGKRLQEVIANGIAEDEGWKIRPMNEYVRLTELRMASSFDFEVVCPKRGKGVLEIKNVDYYQFKKGWVDGEAPPHIEVQAQHQLAVLDDSYTWTCIGAFVGGNQVEKFERERDIDFGNAIKRSVVKFWRDVEEKKEPRPDFYRDGEVIQKVYGEVSGEPMDSTKDVKLNALASKYVRLCDECKHLEDEKEATKNEIHHSLQNNIGAFTSGYRVMATLNKGSAGKIVTPEMVGTVIGRKAGHRRLDISELNKEK